MKLYEVTVEFTMAVVAESEEEARRVAEANAHEDLHNLCGSLSMFTPRQIVSSSDLPVDFQGVIPWGTENDTTCEDLVG